MKSKSNGDTCQVSTVLPKYCATYRPKQIFSFRRFTRTLEGYAGAMRLLDTWTGQFVEKDPRDPETKYAILSHTWDPEGEQTYQDLRDIQRRYAHKRQPQRGPHDAQGDSPSPVERDRDMPSPFPSSLPPVRDMSPTTFSGARDTSSFVPSALHTSHVQSHTSPAVPSSRDEHLEHLDILPCPLWDDPELSPKVRDACKVARANGHRYLWIDSCCIDKTSSSELSEAINSMYQWYRRAVECFALLADVPAQEDHEKEDSKFRKSRWFTRGWTLQELLAPIYVQFFSGEWTLIGSKHSLADLVTEITSIDDAALLHFRPLNRFSVAQRLSWAAKRKTTRLEDRAYSLLGIFDINMPTLYGEGSRAFRRLQEEIMRRIPDQTLFAWTSFLPVFPAPYYDPEKDAFSVSKQFPGLGYISLFAPSLDLFRECGNIIPVSRDEVVRRLRLRCRLHLPVADYYSTPHGIRTQFPIVPFTTYIPVRAPGVRLRQTFLVILQCEHQDHPGHLLGRIAYTQLSSHDVEILYSGCVERFSDGNRYHSDLFPLSPPGRFKGLRWMLRPITIKTFYIPHADIPDDNARRDISRTPHKTINLVLRKMTRDALRAHGYIVNLRGPDHAHPTTHRLTLSKDTHTITVEYQHALEEGRSFSPGLNSPQRLTVEAHWRVELSGTSLEPKSGEPARVQGGCGTLSWTDCMPWNFGFIEGAQGVRLPASIAGTEELWLASELILASKDCYFLYVELTHENPRRASVGQQSWTRGFKTRLGKWVARCVQSL